MILKFHSNFQENWIHCGCAIGLLLSDSPPSWHVQLPTVTLCWSSISYLCQNACWGSGSNDIDCSGSLSWWWCNVLLPHWQADWILQEVVPCTKIPPQPSLGLIKVTVLAFLQADVYNCDVWSMKRSKVLSRFTTRSSVCKTSSWTLHGTWRPDWCICSLYYPGYSNPRRGQFALIAACESTCKVLVRTRINNERMLAAAVASSRLCRNWNDI